jgi:hypothetical protein
MKIRLLTDGRIFFLCGEINWIGEAYSILDDLRAFQAVA